MKNGIKESFRGFHLKGRKYKVDEKGEFRCISGGRGFILNDFASSYEVEYQLKDKEEWINLGRNFCSREAAQDALIELMQKTGNEVYRVRYIEELNIF